MRKHQESVWITKFTDLAYQEVKCFSDRGLQISFFPIKIFDKRPNGVSVLVNRKDARLLAKRINQCLDATVKK